MLDLSEQPLHENIETCKRYLERMSKMGMTLVPHRYGVFMYCSRHSGVISERSPT